MGRKKRTAKYIKLGLKIKALIVLVILVAIYFDHEEIVEKQKIAEVQKEKKEKKVKKVVPISKKKEDFKKLFVPVVTKVYDDLYKKFEDTKELIANSPENEELITLKKRYRVKTNQELLIKLKPHPISIALSQAAIESAWGTSRFFKEAKNIFGVWSFRESEPRIPANATRDGKTIYLKKFNTIEEAVSQYYNMLSSNKVYTEFKIANYYSDNSIEIAKKLLKYSEQGELYTKKIIAVLKYNNFGAYDKHHGLESKNNQETENILEY